jgi:hypothetical protein
MTELGEDTDGAKNSKYSCDVACQPGRVLVNPGPLGVKIFGAEMSFAAEIRCDVTDVAHWARTHKGALWKVYVMSDTRISRGGPIVEHALAVNTLYFVAVPGEEESIIGHASSRWG